MQLIATDGGALSVPVEVEELLVPGNRAEVSIGAIAPLAYAASARFKAKSLYPLDPRPS